MAKLSVVTLCLAILFGVDQVAAKGKDIVIVGDSWGVLGERPFEDMLKDHGSDLTVADYAVSGSTSDDWARHPDKIKDYIDDNPDAQFIWLTVGGNDAKNYLPDCTKKESTDKCVTYITNVIINNTIIMLTPVFESYPDIQVIQFGYDILNFEKGYCSVVGKELIYDCDGNALCINTQFIKLQYNYCDYIATVFPNNYNTRVMLGSLQAYGGVPNATLGNPNLNYWSPSDLMMDNCIHPTQEGFGIIFNNLWDEYFANVTSKTSPK